MSTPNYSPGIQGVQQPRANGILQPEPNAAEPATATASDADVDVRPAAAVGDRITGGPVWGGFAVALATWITLEVMLVAVDLAGISGGADANPDRSEWWWSLAAAVIALFVGGLTAGAASRWRGMGDGILVGVTVWAVTVLALLVLSALGAGIGFGAFGQFFGTGRAAASGANLPTGITDIARNAAGIALLVLALTAAAAAAGGACAAKLWPRRHDAQGRR